MSRIFRNVESEMLGWEIEVDRNMVNAENNPLGTVKLLNNILITDKPISIKHVNILDFIGGLWSASIRNIFLEEEGLFYLDETSFVIRLRVSEKYNTVISFEQGSEVFYSYKNLSKNIAAEFGQIARDVCNNINVIYKEFRPNEFIESLVFLSRKNIGIRGRE